MAEVPPVLLSAIICERIIFDKITSMPTLVNIIQTINAHRYPVRYEQVIFFCELTDGHGRTDAEIKLIDTNEDDKVIFSRTGQVDFKDVKQIVTLAMNLQGMVFPHPGEYRFQLSAQGQLLGERRVVCRKVEMPPGNKPERNE